MSLKTMTCLHIEVKDTAAIPSPVNRFATASPRLANQTAAKDVQGPDTSRIDAGFAHGRWRMAQGSVMPYRR
jgi:hypothetical protein